MLSALGITTFDHHAHASCDPVINIVGRAYKAEYTARSRQFWEGADVWATAALDEWKTQIEASVREAANAGGYPAFEKWTEAFPATKTNLAEIMNVGEQLISSANLASEKAAATTSAVECFLQTTQPGSFSMQMSDADADTLTKDSKAKDIFQKALASTLGVGMDEISISAIYLNGTKVVRRLDPAPLEGPYAPSTTPCPECPSRAQATTLSCTGTNCGSIVKVEFVVTSTQTINTGLMTEETLQTNVQKEAKAVGLTTSLTGTAMTSNNEQTPNSDVSGAPKTMVITILSTTFLWSFGNNHQLVLRKQH